MTPVSGITNPEFCWACRGWGSTCSECAEPNTCDHEYQTQVYGCPTCEGVGILEAGSSLAATDEPAPLHRGDR